jgi:ATP-dependent Clp protease ATP-binding subunit ClpB
VFHKLTRAHLVEIVDIQLARLNALLAGRRITLEVTPQAKAWLAETGYDAVYGARPLRRVIQRELQDPLAIEILQGRFREGDAILADAQDGRLMFSRAEAKDRRNAL